MAAVQPARMNTWMLVLLVILGVFVPVAGIVIAITLLGTGRLREGAIVLATAIAGGALWVALFL